MNDASLEGFFAIPVLQKKIKKLFHYARSDLSFIKHYLKSDVENIQCSKLKSRIGRTFTDKHGLKDLVKEFLDIDISKQKKNSDFGEKFIKLSRDIHILNDSRSKIKLEINNHTGSKIKEIKEYTTY